MNTYQAKTPAFEAVFAAGVFEHEFTPAEEKDLVDAGYLELVPRTYRVVSDNYQVAQGRTFDAAYLIEIESALIAGGHIERVDKPESVKPTPSKAKE